MAAHPVIQQQLEDERQLLAHIERESVRVADAARALQRDIARLDTSILRVLAVPAAHPLCALYTEVAGLLERLNHGALKDAIWVRGGERLDTVEYVYCGCGASYPPLAFDCRCPWCGERYAAVG